METGEFELTFYNRRCQDGYPIAIKQQESRISSSTWYTGHVVVYEPVCITIERTETGIVL